MLPARGGGPAIDSQVLGDGIIATQTLEACRGEDDGVEVGGHTLPVAENARQARIDVAAQLDDLELGEPAAQLRPATR